MLTHQLIWDAIDRLAHRKGLSASGLARLAGLDPTTFNRSKRIGKNGKHRWPTTESLSKVLHATGTTLTDLLGEIENLAQGNNGLRVPVLPRSSGDLARAFDADGKPAGTEWMVGDMLPVSDPAAFGVEVPDERFYPYFRRGNMFIVSPEANVSEGDLVFIRISTPTAVLTVRELVAKDAVSIRVRSPGQVNNIDVIDRSRVGWYSRIILSSL